MRCDVLIPVGPGHEEICQEAAGSVQIAAKYSQGPFAEIGVKFGDDTKGERGRSATRNDLVERSEADWLFFLDADDLMHPNAFFGVPPTIEFRAGAVAVWGAIMEYQNGCISSRYQIPRIGSYEDLIKFDPTMTIQIGHFVRRDIATKYPFNIGMNTGEDWDYYLRIWKDEHCEKIQHPFMLNRRGHHSTGPRSATGKEWNETVEKLINKARGH